MLVFHADLIPTTIRLNKAAHTATVCLAMLPKSHPLQALVARAAHWVPRFHRSPLHELFAAFPDVRGVETIHPVMQSRDASQLVSTGIASRDAAIRNVARYHRNGTCIYSDGSSYKGGAGAVAVCVRCPKTMVRRVCLGMLDNHTVYEGELVGVLLALDIAKTLPLYVRRASILLDNQAAVRAVRARRCRPGQYLVDMIHREILSLIRRRHGFKLHIAWVPGHSDVAGNELADIYAKRAAVGDKTAHSIPALCRELPCSAAAVHAAYKHTVTALHAAWWTDSPAAAKMCRIDDGGPDGHVHRLYKDLPRRAASILTQLRTGHIGLRSFLSRIKVEPSACCDRCHVSETVEHFLLHCRSFVHAHHRLRLRIRKPLSLPILLNKPSSIPALLQFIHDTNRFPAYNDNAPDPQPLPH